MTHDRERLTVRPAHGVPEGATVRHVDQLPEATFDALVGLSDGESEPLAGVEAGDVIVSTSYLEVVRPECDRGGAASVGGRVDTGPVG